MPRAARHPAWYWHLSYVVALVASLSPLVKEWWTPDLISQTDANAKAQREIESMTLVLSQDPILKQSIFNDARGRYEVRVYPDEALLQYRKFPNGKERSAVIPPLAWEQQASAAPSDPAWAVYAASPGEADCSRIYHPAPPKVWTEPVSSCVMVVWRQWPEGCTSRQLYDPCQSAFSDVIWTRCAH